MKCKKYLKIFLVTLVLFPCNVFAYSNKILVGGQNIGIEVKTKGVLVVGLYKVDNELIAENSGITSGDYIIKVNDKEVNTIDEFTKVINENKDKSFVDIIYKRGNKELSGVLNIKIVDNEPKTGLYVKDTINGIGTLTFIDPETKKFGALGHEIIDKSTNEKININDGSIYYSYITGISKSERGNPGEKEATVDEKKNYGVISENTNKGIFGEYTSKLDNGELFEVASKEEIKKGKASIYTVVDGEGIESFDINIDVINNKDDTKNIVFTITDERLLNKTGGIVQGMSGSPIIQNGKIIGAVTHVIINDCKKGYGIFITNMLEESDN